MLKTFRYKGCEEMIEQLVNEINGLLRDGYPYSALGIALTLPDICGNIRFLYNGIIIKHQKTEPTYTKTSLFLCEKRRFFMARREKGVVPIIYFEKERGKSF